MDPLIYAESLLRAGLALGQWLEESAAPDVAGYGLGGLLAEAARYDDEETIVEWIEALAWFGVCEVACLMTPPERERLVVDAFPALGRECDPTTDEDTIVRTLVQSALLEEPEERWGPFFIGICELAGVYEQDIDDWMHLGAHLGLLEAVRTTWESGASPA